MGVMKHNHVMSLSVVTPQRLPPLPQKLSCNCVVSRSACGGSEQRAGLGKMQFSLDSDMTSQYMVQT